MPAPHPLASLARGGPEGLALAKRKLRKLLRRHGGNVTALAAALKPPVHRTTVEDWITRWGMREESEKDP